MRLPPASAGGDGECERGDHGVARARDVAHLLGHGGNVKGFLPALAQQQAQFAQRDEQHGRAQFVEESLGGQHEVLVRQGIRVARFVREGRKFERFLPIRSDQGQPGEV